MVSTWSQIEAIGAGLAAQYLVAHRTEFLSEFDESVEVSIPHLLDFVEHNEPSGLRMALIRGTLNQMLSGMAADEQAAIPNQASALIDWCINALTKVAKQ